MLMFSRQDQTTEIYREQNRDAFLEGVIKPLRDRDKKKEKEK